MLTQKQIDKAALDFADAEYHRLVAKGWSKRDAARYSRAAERDERARLIQQQQASDFDFDSARAAGTERIARGVGAFNEATMWREGRQNEAK